MILLDDFTRFWGRPGFDVNSAACVACRGWYSPR